MMRTQVQNRRTGYVRHTAVRIVPGRTVAMGASRMPGISHATVGFTDGVFTKEVTL